MPNIALRRPDLLLAKAQTSTSYLVPGLSTGVVYCLCVAVLCTVLLQSPGGPLDGLSRYPQVCYGTFRQKTKWLPLTNASNKTLCFLFLQMQRLKKPSR